MGLGAGRGIPPGYLFIYRQLTWLVYVSMSGKRLREETQSAVAILGQIGATTPRRRRRRQGTDVLTVHSLGPGVVIGQSARDPSTTMDFPVPPCLSKGRPGGGGACERMRTVHTRHYNAVSHGDFYRSPCICGCATKTLVSVFCCSCWAFCCDAHWQNHKSFLTGLSDGYIVHRRMHEFLGVR